jgi:alpha-beta hydrolase superfamily lysophospholipase
MPSIVGRATSADGTELLTRHWPADGAEAGGAWAGPAWASLLIVHGLSDHSGRYEHLGEQSAGAGIDAFSYDHRGAGGSDGRRGHVDDWQEMRDDLAGQLTAVRAVSGGRPVALYGNSLGGLLVTGYCLPPAEASAGRSREASAGRSPGGSPVPPLPDLVILSAPALDDGLPRWKTILAPLVGRVAPTLEFPNDIKGEWLSRDPSVGERTSVDPGCVKVSSARFGAEALREHARVRAAVAPDGLGLPTFVIHGGDDELVPTSASAVFEGLPMTTRRVFPGLRHETHNEPEGPEVIDAIIAWLRGQVAVGSEPAAVVG